MPLDVEKVFRDAGALLHGHFLLTSGRHSPVYWEKFRVLQYPHHVVKLCAMIADRFRPERAQVVAGPTTGGILLAFEVGRQLDIRAAYAEKENGGRAIRRGQGIRAGERVLVVDDVLTTGSSVQAVITAVLQAQGEIIGVGVLVDRAEESLDFGYPLYACLRSSAISYTPEDCPQCRQGLPLTRPGGA